MKRFSFVLLGLLLVLGVQSACRQTETQGEATRSELSADARKVVDYLVDDWNKKFRSTSIALAMQNLGLEGDALRLEVGDYLRQHTDLANNLKWWGANNYLLSNEEKIIAKYLITTFVGEKKLPTLQEASRAVGLPEARLSERLQFMAKAGFLKTASDSPLNYVLTEDYDTWGGPLRYNFHTVTVAGEKPFDVW
ncbi:MAG: hypothetical protein D6743_15170 [Calditrichaeota bacterium]|nr:MAG: hypothetical protein D6743_15170 [Calditrichota bacterium]